MIWNFNQISYFQSRFSTTLSNHPHFSISTGHIGHMSPRNQLGRLGNVTDSALFMAKMITFGIRMRRFLFPELREMVPNSPAIAMFFVRSGGYNMNCNFRCVKVKNHLPYKDHWTLKNLSPNNVKTSAGMSRVISMSVTKAPRVRQLKGLQA